MPVLKVCCPFIDCEERGVGVDETAREDVAHRAGSTTCCRVKPLTFWNCDGTVGKPSAVIEASLFEPLKMWTTWSPRNSGGVVLFVRYEPPAALTKNVGLITQSTLPTSSLVELPPVLDPAVVERGLVDRAVGVLVERAQRHALARHAARIDRAAGPGSSRCPAAASARCGGWRCAGSRR